MTEEKKYIVVAYNMKKDFVVLVAKFPMDFDTAVRWISTRENRSNQKLTLAEVAI
jgi:hypothetical protein